MRRRKLDSIHRRVYGPSRRVIWIVDDVPGRLKTIPAGLRRYERTGIWWQTECLARSAAAKAEHGTDIVWSDEIDIAADTLWRLAMEQSGATMTADAFRRWRERHAHTLDAAARALGLSRRMVAYYEEGRRPIPRVVALATRGLELV